MFSRFRSFLTLFSTYWTSFWAADGPSVVEVANQLEEQRSTPYDSLLSSYKKEREIWLVEVERLKKEHKAALETEWEMISELQQRNQAMEAVRLENQRTVLGLEQQHKRDLEKQIAAMALEMAQWKGEELGKAIKSSNVRSRSILRGKNAEHYVPFSEDFLQEFSPSDAKFLGAPIDYVIFKNASRITDKEEAEVEIVFADIKTGKAQLTAVQRAIRKAVENGKIRWKTFELREKYGI